jgi:hypothetical protein
MAEFVDTDCLQFLVSLRTTPVMELQPQISILGIHRKPIPDDSVLAGYEGFLPGPDRAKRVRAYLSRIVLVEALVTNADSDFDPYAIKQSSMSDEFRVSSVVFLTPEGDKLLVDGGEELPCDQKTFRFAMYLHAWDDDEPLMSSCGQCNLPEFTPMPERLQRLVMFRGD